MLLYDYWFTQFDFPDNDGNPYQTSGGKMVWNDTLKRNIPENWKVQSVISNCLSSIIKPGVEIFNTKTYLATADVKGTSISTGTIVDYDGRESRANMQPSINSVWFAKMKNSIKHLYLNKEMQPIISSCILSTGFCGLQCNEISFEYIASYVSNAYFEIHKDMLAHGATQEAVNNDDLAGVHIIIPEDTVLRAYHEATQAIYAQISKNICENQELVKLRDWLLPMLMNGQATIIDWCGHKPLLINYRLSLYYWQFFHQQTITNLQFFVEKSHREFLPQHHKFFRAMYALPSYLMNYVLTALLHFWS